MNNTINTAAVLVFFSGKAHQKAEWALAQIDASLEQGEWIKGVSRSVKASLSKSNVLNKKVKALPESTQADWRIQHEMYYGQFNKILDLDLSGDSALRVLAREYAEAIRPVAEAIDALDATRPKPVFTALEVSPLITSTLVNLDATKAEVAPIEFVRVAFVDEKGQPGFEWVGFTKWPEGTVFGKGKGHMSYHQCELCAHGIKNPYNWVPMIVTGKDGSHKGLWVGKDCAGNLLGAKLTGELKISNRE